MKKHVDQAIYTLLMLVLGLIVFYIIFILYPFRVTQFNSPYKVLTPIVKQGKNLRYQRDLIKYMQLEGTLNCMFKDGILYALPTKTTNTKVGVNNDTVEIQVPTTLPPSQYTYTCVITYRIWFREFRYTFETEKFTVVE